MCFYWTFVLSDVAICLVQKTKDWVKMLNKMKLGKIKGSENSLLLNLWLLFIGSTAIIGLFSQLLWFSGSSLGDLSLSETSLPKITNLFLVQSLSHVQLCVTPWTATRQSFLSFTISQSLPKLVFIELMMPSNHLILYHPLLLPSIFPSIRVFFNESALRIRWPKYWSFSISPFSEYSRLISFRFDWFDLLAVWGALKNLLQQHSSRASILQCSTILIVELSHPYMTTGKIIALTIWTFVSKVMSLLFNTLSRFVIIFLPRSKHLLILWLWSPSAVILEPRKSFPTCFKTTVVPAQPQGDSFEMMNHSKLAQDDSKVSSYVCYCPNTS